MCLEDILEQILHTMDALELLKMVSGIKMQAYKQGKWIIIADLLHKLPEDFNLFHPLKGWQQLETKDTLEIWLSAPFSERSVSLWF